MKWLIKNGTIASEEKTFLADLLLEDDKIIKIDTNIEDAEAKCIDAEGCYVMPGAVLLLRIYLIYQHQLILLLS